MNKKDKTMNHRDTEKIKNEKAGDGFISLCFSLRLCASVVHVFWSSWLAMAVFRISPRLEEFQEGGMGIPPLEDRA
jgi:hypothetical protein